MGWWPRGAAAANRTSAQYWWRRARGSGCGRRPGDLAAAVTEAAVAIAAGLESEAQRGPDQIEENVWISAYTNNVIDPAGRKNSCWFFIVKW